MKVGTEDKKKLTIAAVVGGVALVTMIPLYNELFGGPSTPAVQPAPVVLTAPVAGGAPSQAGGQAAVKVGTSSGRLDPTLHMEAMLRTEALVYSGSGRNIFGAGPTAMEIAEKPVAPARKPVVVLPVAMQGPRPDPGPPPPPPINLKFFGTATTASGVRRALLLNGDDVFLASAGDVVQRRYRVVSIAANSITVEDIPNSNKQTLPLAAN